jgi:hypothetical protein
MPRELVQWQSVATACPHRRAGTALRAWLLCQVVGHTYVRASAVICADSNLPPNTARTLTRPWALVRPAISDCRNGAALPRVRFECHYLRRWCANAAASNHTMALSPEWRQRAVCHQVAAAQGSARCNDAPRRRRRHGPGAELAGAGDYLGGVDRVGITGLGLSLIPFLQPTPGHSVLSSVSSWAQIFGASIKSSDRSWRAYGTQSVQSHPATVLPFTEGTRARCIPHPPAKRRRSAFHIFHSELARRPNNLETTDTNLHFTTVSCSETAFSSYYRRNALCSPEMLRITAVSASIKHLYGLPAAVH